MSGPLEGVQDHRDRGIGPGPFCAMMLADMGADVVRVDRAQNVCGGDPAGAAGRRAQPRPPLDRRRPQAPRRRRDRARARRAGRRADRGLPARRDGAARPRPRRVPRPQPEARLRPHDRLGPGRPVRADRRPRHQLHRARRRARPDRRRGEAAGAAAQPGRRLRRRRHAARLRHGLRAARAPSAPARARSSTPRWSTAPPCSRRCSTPSGPWASGTTSGAPTCSTPARTSTTCTRRPTASTCRSARSSRSSTPSSSGTPGSRARSCPGSRTAPPWPELKERLAGIFKAKTRDEWCEIMEGTDVCFAPVLSLGEAPEHPHNVAPRHLRRARRRRAAGARAAVLRHAGRACSARRPTPASTPTRCWPTWGLDADRVAKLREAGAVRPALGQREPDRLTATQPDHGSGPVALEAASSFSPARRRPMARRRRRRAVAPPRSSARGEGGGHDRSVVAPRRRRRRGPARRPSAGRSDCHLQLDDDWDLAGRRLQCRWSRRQRSWRHAIGPARRCRSPSDLRRGGRARLLRPADQPPKPADVRTARRPGRGA